MASVSLTTLRARVREHADMASTTFVSDAATSLDSFINVGIQKLHDKVLDALGDGYLGETSSSVSVTISGGMGTQALPSGFYRLIGVELTVGGRKVDLKRFRFKERNANYNQSPYIGNPVPQYQLSGSNLRLNGADGAYTGTLWYAAAPSLLVNGSDAVDYPNGWEYYAVLYAAMLALMKEESDVSGIMALLGEEAERIEAAASARDSANPPRMADVERAFTDSDEPWGM